MEYLVVLGSQYLILTAIFGGASQNVDDDNAQTDYEAFTVFSAFLFAIFSIYVAVLLFFKSEFIDTLDLFKSEDQPTGEMATPPTENSQPNEPTDPEYS